VRHLTHQTDARYRSRDSTADPATNPAHEHDTAEATEAREAADTFDSWIAWLDDLRSAIDQGGGDSQDPDSLLASILGYIATETEAAVALGEERATQYARDVLRKAEDSNNKIAAVLRQQREARERQAAEAEALARRLDRMAGAIESVTRENVELRTKLSACEQNLARATAMLEKEIAKERSLRRLLDSRSNRPNAQKIASELARRHAMKVLECCDEGQDRDGGRIMGEVAQLHDQEGDRLIRLAESLGGAENLSEGERWRLNATSTADGGRRPRARSRRA
jgi:hypothetical protein